MKKLYEEPTIEISKFSFEETLADTMRPSDPEGEVGTGGATMPEDGDFDFDW